MAQDIAWRLQDTRKRRGWAQGELAKQAGVGIATVQRLEAGTYDSRISTVAKLADALEVSHDWLLGGAEPMVGINQMTRDEQLKLRPPACKSCQGRGFTWDYEDYDGFYAICSYCDGPEHFVIVELGPWYQDESGEWQSD